MQELYQENQLLWSELNNKHKKKKSNERVLLAHGGASHGIVMPGHAQIDIGDTATLSLDETDPLNPVATFNVAFYAGDVALGAGLVDGIDVSALGGNVTMLISRVSDLEAETSGLTPSWGAGIGNSLVNKALLDLIRPRFTQVPRQKLCVVHLTDRIRSFQFRFEDPYDDNSTLQVVIVNGTIPAWLTLHADGLLNGSIPIPQLHPQNGLFANHTFQVSVLDHQGLYAKMNYTVEVEVRNHSDSFWLKDDYSNWDGTNVAQHFVDLYGPAMPVAGTAPTAAGYAGTATGVEWAWDGEWHPVLERLYFIPYRMAAEALWWYIDTDGTFTSYAHGAGVLPIQAYVTGEWVPTVEKLLLCPYNVASTTWHYIDADGAVVPYSGLNLGSTVYYGMAWIPTLNRVYMTPYAIASAATWHYIDVDTMTVVPYTHNLVHPGLTGGWYVTSQYHPDCNQMLTAPSSASTQAGWAYFDANDETWKLNVHGKSVISPGYHGLAYSPVTQRMYGSPHRNANAAFYEYWDANGVVQSYASAYITAPGLSAYYGINYIPTYGIMFFVPYMGLGTIWHYVDDATLTTYEWAHGVGGLPAGVYTGSAWHPVLNRLYLVPDYQSSTYHYLDCDTGVYEQDGRWIRVINSSR